MRQSTKKIGTNGTETKQPKMTKPVNLTPEELAIYQRVKTEGERAREWETIAESDIEDFSLREDPMKLPEFAQKLKDAKLYAFRWVEKSKERLDGIRSMSPPMKWWIVNAATIPESTDDVDPVLGYVSKLDQLLVFKPYWMFAAQQRIKREMADNKNQAGDVHKKDGFVPADNIQLRAGPDFKISSKDEVVADEQEFIGGNESEGFDELVTNE